MAHEMTAEATLAVAASRKEKTQRLENVPESKSFLGTALTWHGSVTPLVIQRVIVTAFYSGAVYYIAHFFPSFGLPITPFEYSGAILALILVTRVNAGHDRWWEARKLWGSIVNQSRNLGMVIASFSKDQSSTREELLKWIAAWPFVMKASLRQDRDLREIEPILGKELTAAIREEDAMAVYVGLRITRLLSELAKEGMEPHMLHRAEAERSQLVDAFGACERIKNTRMPLALAIKTRRFIFLFLLLLPLALVDRAGWLTPLVVALASYPLFSLDEIGAELQNPFSTANLSHLPLDGICANIARNVLRFGRS